LKTRLIGAAAALLLATTGTVAVTSYVQGADQRALRGAEVKTIYVVDKEVPASTPAAELTKFIRTSPVPSSAIAEGAVTDLASLDGKVTSGKLLPGEQLLSARLVDPASLAVPGKVAVPNGLQEVTIQLTADRVAGGQLSAGDTVGVFVSFTDGAGQGSPTTHLAFQKVLVTSVQGAPAEATGKAAATTAPGPPVPAGTMLITLARSAHDAEKVVFAAEFGTIWLSKDPAAANGDGTSVITKDSYYK
jgi:pilus assembly protein CpaB